jgi:hypothetical protein
LIIAALLLAADRAALFIAQPVAAHAIQRQLVLEKTPRVHIHGFPFLTQALARRYDDVTVSMVALTVAGTGRSVRVDQLNARFAELRTSADFRSARADSASGSALLRYSDLSAALGTEITFGGRGPDGRGRLKASRTVSALGQSVSGTATVQVVVAGPTSLSFTSPQVGVGGASVPQPVVDALTSTFATPVNLAGLPAGMHLDSVQVTAAGVTVVVSGRNVVLGEG